MALMLEDKEQQKDKKLSAATLSGGILAGVSLTENTAQVSFLRPGAVEAETLSAIAGAEYFDHPLVLARRRDNGQWIFGRDAVKAYSAGDAEIAEDLIRLACEGRTIAIGGERYTGITLLLLYMRKLLLQTVMEAAGAGAGLEVIRALMLTADVIYPEAAGRSIGEAGADGAEQELHGTLDERLPQVLNAVCAELKKTVRNAREISWCTLSESLYYYLNGQPEDIRSQEVLAFWCPKDQPVSYLHSINRFTRPQVASVVRTEEEALPGGGASDDARDEAFLKIVTERLSGHIVSAVYLLGDGFNERWLKRSLEYICRTRKAFLGNNLFSKGAVACLKDRLGETEAAAQEQTVFLSPDKILANIGIRVKKQGTSHYHALLDAGTSWYDARASIEVVLDKDPRIALIVTPLDGSGAHTEVLELDGLPKRERRMTRLQVELKMRSVDRARLSVVDEGFGDMAPASGGHWEKYISLTAGEGSQGLLAPGVITEPILCIGRLASRPYDFPFLENRVFSAEELCHLIARNDYLLTRDSFTEDFPDWLESECRLAPLAEELRELKRKDVSLAAYAGTILDYIRLFPDDERIRIKEVLRDGDSRDGVEKKLKIIEYLIREGRLTEAHARIAGFDRKDQNEIVIARLLYDEGVIYARMFHYAAAARRMGRAYELSHDPEVKEAYLAALRLSMREEEYIDVIGARPELSPESLTLETKLGETLDLFAAGADNHLVGTLQVCLDTGNLKSFDEETAKLAEDLLAAFKRAIA
ncbi:MAG: hypothetical protein II800_02305 [Lachnospiraceae bacterium]|nr:hypothetical protein [Lachnospiraceae bacterium]